MEQINSLAEYHSQYKQSVADPESYWAAVAHDYHWFKPWDKVLNWNFDEPKVEWYAGGYTNLSYNCLDRHLTKHSDKTAIIWEQNDPSLPAVSITYRELYEQVCRLANAMLSLGITQGDRVCIYLPMIPEAAIAMLACTRIGAVHSVVFAGFSAQSLIDRINDAGGKLILTADIAKRGEKIINLKNIVDEALLQCPTIEHCIVYHQGDGAIKMEQGRDLSWSELITSQSTECPAVAMDAESPLFILYTSGSTGKPKGVLHTTGGYMVYAGHTFKNVFNYQQGEIFCCTADIGWVTGHSYLIYGPLLNGGTTVIFEGIPTYPDHGRFWDIVARHQVNIFYTAPTAIRALMAHGTDIFEGKNLNSLRVLGTVGEPINEEAWDWYHQQVGKGKCDIVDTWWQTETGGILISPIATVTPLIPCFATLPLPGVQLEILNDKGEILEGNDVEGNLCITHPWPGMARTLYGDHERFRLTYFSTYLGYYFTGDGCKRDKNGYYRITGRVDDVINVSGHRIGTGELEDAINSQHDVIESAVVGYPHDIKGQGIYAYVVCDKVVSDVAAMEQQLKSLVAQIVGPFARPDKIQIVTALPKTRSGKIMRRILRKIAEGEVNSLGDTTTLLDATVVEKIVAGRL